MTDPRTPAEWQEAVDLAELRISIHAAQCYGLVTGDPDDTNVERCEEILRRGAQRGVRPKPIDMLCALYLTPAYTAAPLPENPERR